LAELTFRWATEDPNPQEKIDEQKRISEQGQKAISGMLDENLVEATQALRALEDGDEEDYYPIEASAPSPEEEDERPTKKSRGDDVAYKGGEKVGMFGGDAIDNIKFYAEMARKQAEEERKRKVPAKAGIAGMLGGYGSGDESD
jgi:hypothetical protein